MRHPFARETRGAMDRHPLIRQYIDRGVPDVDPEDAARFIHRGICTGKVRDLPFPTLPETPEERAAALSLQIIEKGRIDAEIWEDYSCPILELLADNCAGFQTGFADVWSFQEWCVTQYYPDNTYALPASCRYGHDRVRILETAILSNDDLFAVVEAWATGPRGVPMWLRMQLTPAGRLMVRVTTSDDARDVEVSL